MKIITDKQKWNQLIKENYQNEFLQSWEWGNFQKALGFPVFRIKPDSSKEPVLITQRPLILNFSYLYSPRGPKKISSSLIEEIKNFFLKNSKKKIIFWRVEPLIEPNIKSSSLKKRENVQPGQTLILNLNQDLEEILSKMHHKTRYNIRLGKRHNVKVRKSKEQELNKDIKIFYSLLKETSKRNNFKIWGEFYFQNLIKSLPNDFFGLYFAEKDKKPLAANLVIFFNKRAVYLYGASSTKNRNLMASYILHWEIIKQAKIKGYEEYDFWGIDETKWPGLTRFKKNFGGEIVKYPGTYDIVFQKTWYYLYSKIRK